MQYRFSLTCGKRPCCGGGQPSRSLRAGWVGQHGAFVFQIDRIIDIGNEFLLFSQFFIDPRTCDAVSAGGREIDGVDFRRELNLTINGIAYDMRAGEFPAPICRKIGMPARTFGTILDIRAAASNQRQRYFQRAFIPPCARWPHVAEFDPNTVSRIAPSEGP